MKIRDLCSAPMGLFRYLTMPFASRNEAHIFVLWQPYQNTQFSCTSLGKVPKNLLLKNVNVNHSFLWLILINKKDSKKVDLFASMMHPIHHQKCRSIYLVLPSTFSASLTKLTKLCQTFSQLIIFFFMRKIDQLCQIEPAKFYPEKLGGKKTWQRNNVH